VAAALYDGGGNWKDRQKAMTFLENDCEMPQSNARRACDTVDIVHRLTIEDDPDGVGVPSVEQVNRIARADMKKVEGGVGIVNGWVVKKWGRWDKVSPKELAKKCQMVKDDALGVAADKKALQTPEDEHPPADANVVDGTAVEVVVPVPGQRTTLNDPQQQAAARRARAADVFQDLARTGSSMLAVLEDFDPTHPWVQENSSDWLRAVQAVDQIRALIDDATKLRADELPL
jgi:hypothetical protein